MYSFTFYKNSKKIFDKLDVKFQNQLIEKLKFLKTVDDIFIYLQKLKNMLPATHRLRLWKMRVIFEQDKDNENHFYVSKIWKRGDIYK